MADIAHYAYQPSLRRITISRRLDATAQRCALAVALAHHALGHRGNHVEQDVAARELAAAWLVSEEDLAAAVLEVGPDPWALAARLTVTRPMMAVRLGLVCEHLPNAHLFAGRGCRCARVVALENQTGLA